MAFYGDLSKHYEDIFPLSEDRLKLVHKYLPIGAQILDIGCSTGELAIAVAKEGYKTFGVDLSPEMIEKARQNASAESVNVHFQTGDMRTIGQIYQQQFDGILCLGNTIVHLTSVNDLRQFFQQIYDLLLPGGVFLFQIVNYDRILHYRVKELPVIKNAKEGLEFYRYYDFNPENKLIQFKTKLVVNGGEEVNHAVQLYPLTGDEIRLILGTCGFMKPHFYGNFAEEPFDPDQSAALVVAVGKR